MEVRWFYQGKRSLCLDGFGSGVRWGIAGKERIGVEGSVHTRLDIMTRVRSVGLKSMSF